MPSSADEKANVPGTSASSAEWRMLWNKIFDLTYRAWIAELAFGGLLSFWRKVDTGVGILTAITSGGAGVAGWTLWDEPDWKALWATVAGVAMLASIAHTKFGIARIIEDTERAWSAHLHLRTLGKTLLDRLDLGGVDLEEAKKLFLELPPQKEKAELAFKPGLIKPSKKRQDKAQTQVDSELKSEIARRSGRRGPF